MVQRGRAGIQMPGIPALLLCTIIHEALIPVRIHTSFSKAYYFKWLAGETVERLHKTSPGATGDQQLCDVENVIAHVRHWNIAARLE